MIPVSLSIKASLLETKSFLMQFLTKNDFLGVPRSNFSIDLPPRVDTFLQYGTRHIRGLRAVHLRATLGLVPWRRKLSHSSLRVQEEDQAALALRQTPTTINRQVSTQQAWLSFAFYHKFIALFSQQ